MTQTRSTVGVGPGFTRTRSAQHRTVKASDGHQHRLEHGAIIDGALSRDPGNPAPDSDMLRAGLLMGRITATNFYRPSVIGVLTSTFSTPGTSIAVDAAVATEVARLLAEAGTDIGLTLIGPPSAGGTVAVLQVTCSAASGTTLTVTDPGADLIDGSFVSPQDGSEYPTGLIDDGHPIPVTDIDKMSVNVEARRLLIAGSIDTEQIINVPTNTPLRNWMKAQLNGGADDTPAKGPFLFRDNYHSTS